MAGQGQVGVAEAGRFHVDHYLSTDRIRELHLFGDEPGANFSHDGGFHGVPLGVSLWVSVVVSAPGLEADDVQDRPPNQGGSMRTSWSTSASSVRAMSSVSQASMSPYAAPAM